MNALQTNETAKQLESDPPDVEEVNKLVIHTIYWEIFRGQIFQGN